MARRPSKKSTEKQQTSNKKTSRPEPESDDDSGSEVAADEKVIQTVKKFKPTIKIDLVAQTKLDQMLATPTLQAALSGTASDPFLVILIKKRFANDNMLSTVVRDRVSSTSGMDFIASLHDELKAATVPALLQIEDFIVHSEQNEIRLVVKSFSFISTGVDLANYVAKKLPVPTLVKGCLTDTGKTEKVDVFDLINGQRNIELEVSISNVKINEKKDGTPFMTFDCEDHTGNVRGIAWDNVELLGGIMKNGTTVNIKRPVVKQPDPMYLVRYSCKLEITIGKNSQVKVLRK